MSSFNKCILIGNMTADPELKQTASGESVCSFSIAVNRKFSKNNECDFINIVAWRSNAEFVSRYFKRGTPILVCGQLQTRTWNDNHGQKRYATEVVADELSFVQSKNDNGGAAQPTQSAPSAPYTPTGYGTVQNTPVGFEDIPNDVDLPF